MGPILATILATAGRFLAPVAKWIGLNILLPWLVSQLNALKTYVSDRLKFKKRAEKAEQGNANYEAKPSDDTFGESP
jgi:hypothetical protein